MKQLTSRSGLAPPAPGPGETTRVDLAAEFEGMARLARGIARTRFASISITGVGETWCGSDSPRSALPGSAEWPLCNGANEVLGALAVHDTATLHLTDEQQGLLAELARQCAASAELHARIAELELLQREAAAPGTLHRRPALPPTRCSTAPRSLSITSMLLAESTIATPSIAAFSDCAADQRPNEWAQGVHPEDLDGVKAGWAEYCARPRPMAFEYRSRPEQGEVRFYAEHVRPLPGNAYIGTISDFTDLVKARGELHKIENLFRNTFDQAPIGVAFANPQGRFLRFNEAFRTLLGYAKRRALGSFHSGSHPPG